MTATAAFVRVPAALVGDVRLTLQARAVYAVLAQLVWQQGKKLGDEVELPPLDVIAGHCGVTENTLRNHVKELRELTWIVVLRASRRRTQRYVIHPAVSTANSEVLDAPSTANIEVLDARARVIGGGSSLDVYELEGEGKVKNTRACEDEPPPIVWVGGTNIALNTLCEVTGIDQKSPRFQQALVALSGRLDKNTGKVKEPGIRHLFWIECVRWAEDHDAIDRLDVAHDDPEKWAHALVRRIQEKAERYTATYPGAALSPKALRDHWLDLERAAQRSGAGMSADDMAAYGG